MKKSKILISGFCSSLSSEPSSVDIPSATMSSRRFTLTSGLILRSSCLCRCNAACQSCLSKRAIAAALFSSYSLVICTLWCFWVEPKLHFLLTEQIVVLVVLIGALRLFVTVLNISLTKKKVYDSKLYHIIFIYLLQLIRNSLLPVLVSRRHYLNFLV